MAHGQSQDEDSVVLVSKASGSSHLGMVDCGVWSRFHSRREFSGGPAMAPWLVDGSLFVAELHKPFWVHSWGGSMIQPPPRRPLKTFFSQEQGRQMLLILGLGH